MLPPKRTLTCNEAIGASEMVVLHVEVKFAERSDHCYMIIIVWDEMLEHCDKWTMSLKNDSQLPLSLRQDIVMPQLGG